MGQRSSRMKRRRHTPEQIVRKLREAGSVAGRGQGAAGGLEGARGFGGDVSPVAGAVRGDEGRRREAVEGARGGERAAEARCGRSSARGGGAEGGREGTDENQVRFGTSLAAAARWRCRWCQSATVR